MFTSSILGSNFANLMRFFIFENRKTEQKHQIFASFETLRMFQKRFSGDFPKTFFLEMLEREEEPNKTSHSSLKFPEKITRLFYTKDPSSISNC